jgi:hypothetical protein
MRAAALALALALAGCATLEEPLRGHLESGSAPRRECARWFEALDAQIDAAGVRDAQEARPAGFPYLRANRLLAALARGAQGDDAALQALADRMAALDAGARRAELANLPEARVAALPGLVLGASRGEALARTRECARLLRELDLAKPEARRLLQERSSVPDDYSLLARAIGLYPLTRIPFSAGVRRWEAEMRGAFARAPETLPGRVRVRYAPPAPAARGSGGPAGAPAKAAANALGIPEPAEEDLEALFAAHAPTFEVEVAGDHDRFGELRWMRDEPAPGVDAAHPHVYVHAAHTRYRGRVLLQLVYTIWFSERPPQVPGDILAGKLDGLTWRVTLAPGGEPLVYDAIHPCGCFHMFFPTERAREIPAPDDLQEWAFVPQRLPRAAPGERPRVRIASGTHYIEGVVLVRGADSVARYAFRPYDDLRSLARPLGGRASAFGPDGLVAGSERPERFLFWPMGIASPGAMRQWGRHATAFVGRRHFDDADLFEKRFVLDLE